MSMHGEAAIERAVLHTGFHHGDHYGSDSQYAPTPKPGRARDQKQKLAVALSGYMSNYDAEPEILAGLMATQPVEVQQNLAKFANALVGLWAEMGEYTQPTHPLATVYANARKMVKNLFT